MKEGMYLDGGGCGGEGDEGASSLIAYGQGGRVEEVVDTANEAGALHGICMTHLGVMVLQFNQYQLSRCRPIYNRMHFIHHTGCEALV